MAAKFIVLSLLVASVYGSGGYSSFSYGVADPNTGDVKDQHEKRIGDSVVGKYSLLESDGTKRIVEYEANDATGFNAIVRKEPAVGVHQPGSLAAASLRHRPLGQTTHGSYTPLPHPSPIASNNPLFHAVPAAPVSPLAHSSALHHSNALSHSAALPYPGALPHAGATLNSGTLGHAGGLDRNIAISHLPHTGIPHPGAFNPHANHIAGAYNGANGHNNLNRPQGVPAVSHFSHSIIHEIPRGYSGPYAGFQGGLYGGLYGGYGSHGKHGVLTGSLAHAAPLVHGIAGTSSVLENQGLAGIHALSRANQHAAAGPLALHGVPAAHVPPAAHSIVGDHGFPGAHGLAHSFNSLTRGEAYPHGYGGYGARGYDTGHGAGLEAGYGANLGERLAW